MVTTTGSLSASTSNAGGFFGSHPVDKAAPVRAGCRTGLFESDVHRRLAAADLVIALVLGHLVLGHGAPGILFTRRGAGSPRCPIATAKFATI